MPFTKPPPRPVPTKIGEIRIQFMDIDSDSNKITGRVTIDIFSATNEQVETFNSDLLPHLTTAQRNGIIALLGAIRTKAQSELL